MKSLSLPWVVLVLCFLAVGCGGGDGPVAPGSSVPPTASAFISSNPPYLEGLPVSFDGSASVDNDHEGETIVRWEWDWENDGVFDHETTSAVTSHTYVEPGKYEIQLRVTDNEGDTDVLDDPIDITIVPSGEEVPPVAKANAHPLTQYIDKPVHFYDIGSYDPDGGEIIRYEWDWDYDGIYDEEGADVYHSWDQAGTYFVGFRVTDDDGKVDVNDTLLIIEIIDPFETGWARTWGGLEFDEGEKLVVDNAGNVYVAGYYKFIVDFDTGNDYNWHTTNGVEDIYLSKFDPAGSLLWVNTWGGKKTDNLTDIAVDDSGNVYCTGYFRYTVDFDPGPGVETRSSNGGRDIYLVKFDSTGSFQWVHTLGGSERDFGLAVALDETGDVYLSGGFSGNVDFDPGPGIHILYAVDEIDAFLGKYDSSGQFLWAVNWGGEGAAGVFEIATGNLGDVYILGTYSDTVDFDPGPGIAEFKSFEYSDIYISKFDSAGLFQWACVWGGNKSDYGYELVIDDFDNVYVTGYFQLVVDFDPGPGYEWRTAWGSIAGDAFLSKLNTDGEFQWVRTWAGMMHDIGYGLDTDQSGNIYVVGSFQENVDFDPGPGVTAIDAVGGADCFLTVFDPWGEFLWVRTWGANSRDQAKSVAIDDVGQIYVTGSFNKAVDFDPGPSFDEHISIGESDAFLLNFLPDGNWE